MRLFLTISITFIISIILIIIFYIINIKPDREIALNICFIGIAIVIISFISAILKRDEGFLIAAIGLSIIMIIASFGEGQAGPVIGGLLCGLSVFLPLYIMIKTKYFLRLERDSLDNVQGNWEIDEKGHINNIDFPKDWPPPGVMKNNIYGLWLAPPTVFKKEIEYMKMGILKFRTRNPDHERNLRPLIHNAIKKTYDKETIEINGGIDYLIENIPWEEFKRP